jgi:hypothetical protein
MAYIGKSPTGTGVRSRYYYTATGGETSLSGADDNSNTLVFSDGNYVDVSLNGIALVAGTDYNTSTANTIAGLSALSASDIVEIVVYDIFTVADTVSAKDGGTFSGNVAMGGTLSVTGASTLTGDLTVDTNTLYVDSTNNRVGIVNASPSTPLDVVGTGQFTNTSAGASATAIKLQNLDNTTGSATSLDFAPYGNGTVTDKIEGGHDGSNKFSLRFHTYSSGLAERMRIDGDGTLIINDTARTLNCFQHLKFNGQIQQGIVIENSVNNQGGAAIRFMDYLGNYTGGGIYFQSSNSISYSTSSDYRLKENVTALTGATERIKQIPVYRFNFVDTPAKTVDGFLAHEVQSVVPEAISGTHDEVETWTQDEIDAGDAPANTSAGDNKLDDDGNTIPVYQCIDQSKLVPLLVKTIQELEARITALENVE